MYDVAVVGAGPAGATAAYYLAEMGHSVCLIDKSIFPRDKPCGGGFAPTITHDFPYLKEREEELTQAICRIGVLHSSNRQVILKGKAEMAVGLRIEFDNVLYETAVEAGAESITGRRTKTISFNEDGVVLYSAKGESIKARTIIGADGVNSLVARSAGLNRRWPSSKVTACHVVEIPAPEKEIIDVYTDDREYHFFANLGGKPGYGWVFPKTHTINVGLGIIGNRSKGLPERFALFVRFLRREGLLPSDAISSHARGALLPTGGPLKKTIRDRCVLVGDAAGMVNPLTGGGIVYAMRAGRFAASALSGCLEMEDLSTPSMMRYQKLWMDDFGGDFGRQLMAQRVLTGAFADTLFEIGARDVVIQDMVTTMMSEGAEGPKSLLKLLGRFLYVSCREAIS